MNYSRKKVNFIIFAMIILIALVSIFASINFIEEEEVISPDVIAENENTESNESGMVAEEKPVELKKAPTFSSGWAALNYAYSLMGNNDYVSISSTVGQNDPILGIVVTQLVNEKKYKSGNECFIINDASSSSSEGANYKRYIYSDSKDVSIKYEGGKSTTYLLDEYVNKFGYNPAGSYFTLNSKNSNLDSFKISGASYVLKITVNASIPGVFETMEKSLTNTPKEVKDAKGISATFEIKINRKTGAFESIKSTERYYMKANTSFGWQGSTITTTTTQTYTWKSTDISNLKKVID